MSGSKTRNAGRPAELLLVESDAADVRLAREGFRIGRVVNNLTVAANGEEALRRLRREGPFADNPAPDLILLDLHLPDIEGQELLRQIKSDPELLRIPVIVLTSSAAEIALLGSYTPLADGYLAKPLDFERLREAVAPLGAFGAALMIVSTD